MKTWCGWLPWNPAICKYEQLSDRFVLAQMESGVKNAGIDFPRGELY